LAAGALKTLAEALNVMPKAARSVAAEPGHGQEGGCEHQNKDASNDRHHNAA
jgi:hypothetical protein